MTGLVRRRACALLGLFGLLLGGCIRGWVPDVGEPAPVEPNPEAEARYRGTLERYTRKGEVHEGFDTRVFVAATHEAEPFVEERVRRVGVFRAEPPARVQERLASERARLQGVHEFLIGVHAGESEFGELDRRGSLWRVSLVTEGGRELEASEVRRVGRATVDLKAIYPYLSEFWVAYRVRFPAEGPVDTLKLASPLGKLELDF